MTEKRGKAFAAAVSTLPDVAAAAREAASSVREGLGGPCDLAFLFVSDFHASPPKAEELSELARATLSCRFLLGCNSSGVVAGDREIEMEPAVAVMGMTLPGVKFTPFHFPGGGRPRLDPREFVETLDLYPTDKPKFLALADPGSCDIEEWMETFNEAYPEAPVMGGLASGMAVGRPNWLALDGEVYREGFAGLGLSGDVDFEIAVAQGCRPIGGPLIITRAERNILQGLGGKPPMEVLRGLLESLSPADRALASRSLFAGIVMDERRTRFQRGDFLVRNLMGFDPSSGAIAAGASLRVGQTFQFQLRDAKTSDEDLRAHLESLGKSGARAGALLFSCCGRGRGLYGAPDHDARMIQKMKGPVPLAGFFANGEIGPVGRRNYVHGYTSSIVFIR